MFVFLIKKGIVSSCDVTVGSKRH